MSNINYLGIDENFPIPGVDNSSEGFRRNFKVIKESLREAKTEIENATTGAVRIDQSNDFDGNDIVNANLISPTANIFDAGLISNDTDIIFDRGYYQVYTIGTNLTLNFRNFPTSGKYGVIRLVLKGLNKTVSFSAIGGSIFYDRTFPSTLTVSSETNPEIIEVWYQENVGYFLKYLNNFNTVRSGGIDVGGGVIPVATTTSLGVVKIGTGLTVQTDGTLSGFSGNYADLQNRVTDISQLTDTTDLLFSGDYNDLTNVPDIADIIGEGDVVTSENIVSAINGVVSDIPGDVATDSITTTATPSSTTAAVKNLTLTTTSLLSHFKVGQKLRVFGASTTNTKVEDVGTIVTVKNGFVSGDAGTDEVEYKVSLFDLTTGSYGIASPGAVVTGVNKTKFNLSNNINLTINRASPNQGILIYRRSGASVFGLIAIIGSKDLGTASTVSYVDYYNFDRTIWSGLSEDNTYLATTGIVHFPFVAPTSASYGWVDDEIAAINTDTNIISLKNSYFFNSTITISHNDTELIQDTIDQKLLSGIKELTLGSKTYHISNLVIPNNFIIKGVGDTTVLKRVPWGSNLDNSNKIFESNNSESAVNTVIKNLSIDGNMQNQYLIDETEDDFINYAIDVSGTNVQFYNLNISNVPGGGIASTESNRLFIQQSQITNSGVNDRYPASPVFSSDSFNVIIVNNLMKNFSESLEASLTNTGMIIGNIVENCGSGITVYGSLRLISNPNLILGPAGEFIPGPDVFDSEYDAVNIVLEPNTTFISDVYVYQENGSLFDLTANRASVIYRVDKLRKINNVEELYGEIQINGVTPIVDYLGPNRTLGQFKFAISETDVDTLKTTYSYSALKASDANHQGLVYRAILKEYTPVVSVDTTVTPTKNLIGGDWIYEVALLSTNDLNIGANIRFLNHGGTPSLDSAVGIINSINPTTKICTIKYDFEITAVGSGGQIARENSFVLAKGKIQ